MSENKPERDYLTFEELDNEFQTWSSQHGDYEEMRNGMPFYRIRNKADAMNALVLRFIEIGYSEKQIRSSTISDRLQRFSTSYRHPNKDKWKLQIKKHWEFAINQRFPSTTEAIESQPIEHIKAEVNLETPTSAPKNTKDITTLDMSKYEGFGKPLRKDTEENILAGILEDDNE